MDTTKLSNKTKLDLVLQLLYELGVDPATDLTYKIVCTGCDKFISFDGRYYIEYNALGKDDKEMYYSGSTEVCGDCSRVFESKCDECTSYHQVIRTCDEHARLTEKELGEMCQE